MRTRTVIVAGLAALVVAGCSEKQSKTSSDAAQATSDTSAATAPAAPTTAPSRGKPKLTVPSGRPPQKLVIKDLIVGKGAPVKAGDTISADYIGVSYSDGKVFDNSYDRGQPIQFPLGTGGVIPGWDQGIVGMKVGGRRQLIIPPALAYGPQGKPPIKPNETLIFDVDLIGKQ